ncbi:hypothetical protein B0H65DRAFT_477740 [Neurospora tetraspora]|uniref:Uncharacterized protein n=1 Tax=Neurospora tetraspora TaxID=94610 RepID=A0AAE0J7Q2_9PEZI|nr:hypothetical protein B0H65DRAFT_477740 [Neurospora tetraspora]
METHQRRRGSPASPASGDGSPPTRQHHPEAGKCGPSPPKRTQSSTGSRTDRHAWLIYPVVSRQPIPPPAPNTPRTMGWRTHEPLGLPLLPRPIQPPGETFRTCICGEPCKKGHFFRCPLVTWQNPRATSDAPHAFGTSHATFLARLRALKDEGLTGVTTTADGRLLGTRAPLPEPDDTDDEAFPIIPPSPS